MELTKQAWLWQDSNDCTESNGKKTNFNDEFCHISATLKGTLMYFRGHDVCCAVMLPAPSQTQLSPFDTLKKQTHQWEGSLIIRLQIDCEYVLEQNVHHMLEIVYRLPKQKGKKLKRIIFTTYHLRHP